MKQIADCTVLIVEDEKMNRDLLSKTLAPLCKTVAVDNGLAALESLTDNIPDLILLDIMLPGMDGLSVCRELKGIPATKDVPVIFISGLGDNDDETLGFELGAVDYIIKPFWPALVVARVENQLKFRLSQHKLELARQELQGLYDETLLRSVHVIADLLSLTNQTAFGQTPNVRRLAKAIAKDMGRPNPWKHDLAAQFVNLGCVSMPQDSLHNIFSQKGDVPEDDRQIFDECPALSAKLIRKIPRLEDVATIIEGHRNPYDPDSGEPMMIARQILRASIDFNTLQFKGMTSEEALSVLKGSVAPYHPDVVASLEKVLKIEGEHVGLFELPPDRITPGMILDQDVYSVAGVLLAAKGMEVDEAVMKILARLTRKGSDPLIRVRAPKD